jgi:ABC-2 type transport system ATP-binding protein
LRCLCTLAEPDAGKVEVAGISVIEQPRLARQYLGYIAQEVALDKVLTGRELLQLQAALYHLPRSIAQERIGIVLKLLDLESYADQKNGHLFRWAEKASGFSSGTLTPTASIGSR